MDIVSTPSPLQLWAIELRDRHGTLTPEIVLEAARAPDSPAHRFIFNVDHADAAEKYYLERAHRLIQSISVTIVANEGESPRRVRYFHALPGDEESGYVYEPLDHLVREPDKLQVARNEAIRRLNEAERSVEDLDAIAGGTVAAANATVALKSIRRAKKALASTP